MLTGRTRLVGLLGDPVSHSLSPLMQNAAFAARGLDWAYVPLRVSPDLLEDAVAGLVALEFAGANVTAPHKTSVVAFCDELDEGAERAGSVNTLVVRDGLVHGSTTDARPVVAALGGSRGTALVLGAGGAAQAVATALVEEGAERLAVAARNPERAQALAARLRTLFPDRAVDATESWPPDASAARLVVNATPVVEDPLVALGPDQVAVDLAYRPDGRPTAFVEAARSTACELVVDGLDVLAGQGAASFEQWTGLPGPEEIMRAAVRDVGARPAPL